MTCWFNANNKGQAGYSRSSRSRASFCEIRGLEIVSSAYTYCANHPHRCPQRDDVPIGPIMTGDSSGYRELWKPSPDTEAIRVHLLALLQEVKETPGDEYPIGTQLEETVIWQLGEFREARAVPDLKRIVAFDPDTKDRFGGNRRKTVDTANEALLKITEPV